MVESSKEEWLQFCEEHKEQVTDKEKVNILDEFDELGLGFAIALDKDYAMCVADLENYGCVVHELFHVAHMLLYSRGYIADETAEPEAYLLEFLINEFYKEFGEEKSAESQ